MPSSTPRGGQTASTKFSTTSLSPADGRLPPDRKARLHREQLSALADRTKTTEDTVDAAREKNRQKREDQRAAIKTSAEKHADSAKADIAGAKSKAGAKGDVARASNDSRFAAMHDHAQPT
jgi:hypothetical protein